MDIVVYRISSVSGLLMNNPDCMANQTGSGMTGKKKYIAEDEAEMRTYRDPNTKQLRYRSMAFRAAMLKAAGGRKIGKATARQVLSGCVFPMEEWAGLVDHDMQPLSTYEIHSVRVVVVKSAVMRQRPLLPEWSVRLPLEVDTEMLGNLEVVTQVLNLAGKIIGVGDWRVEKGGMFGRFTAEVESGLNGQAETKAAKPKKKAIAR